MKVYASDGESLGKIVDVGDTTFVIEKGFFFPKEYVARRDQIADVRDGEIWLTQTAAMLREGSLETRREPTRGTLRSEEEVRVPLAEEELHASTHQRETGAVRVHKDVVTEEKSISVPVRREEIHVERVPATGDAAEASFQEGDVRVPIREEVVEVEKRPVVREEVRVSKTAHEEEEHVRARTRKETAEVEKDGQAKRVRDEGHRNP